MLKGNLNLRSSNEYEGKVHWLVYPTNFYASTTCSFKISILPTSKDIKEIVFYFGRSNDYPGTTCLTDDEKFSVKFSSAEIENNWEVRKNENSTLIISPRNGASPDTLKKRLIEIIFDKVRINNIEGKTVIRARINYVDGSHNSLEDFTVSVNASVKDQEAFLGGFTTSYDQDTVIKGDSFQLFWSAKFPEDANDAGLLLSWTDEKSIRQHPELELNVRSYPSDPITHPLQICQSTTFNFNVVNKISKATLLPSLQKQFIVTTLEPLLSFQPQPNYVNWGVQTYLTWQGYDLELRYEERPLDNDIKYNTLYLYLNGDSLEYAVRNEDSTVKRIQLKVELGEFTKGIQEVLTDTTKSDIILNSTQIQKLFEVTSSQGYPLKSRLPQNTSLFLSGDGITNGGGSFALSEFTTDEVESLQNLVGASCKKIQEINAKTKEYIQIYFEFEEINEIRDKLAKISTKEAEDLSKKLIGGQSIELTDSKYYQILPAFSTNEYTLTAKYTYNGVEQTLEAKTEVSVCPIVNSSLVDQYFTARTFSAKNNLILWAQTNDLNGLTFYNLQSHIKSGIGFGNVKKILNDANLGNGYCFIATQDTTLYMIATDDEKGLKIISDVKFNVKDAICVMPNDAHDNRHLITLTDNSLTLYSFPRNRSGFLDLSLLLQLKSLTINASHLLYRPDKQHLYAYGSSGNIVYLDPISMQKLDNGDMQDTWFRQIDGVVYSEKYKKLYVNERDNGQIVIFDADTGKQTNIIKYAPKQPAIEGPSIVLDAKNDVIFVVTDKYQPADKPYSVDSIFIMVHLKTEKIIQFAPRTDNVTLKSVYLAESEDLYLVGLDNNNKVIRYQLKLNFVAENKSTPKYNLSSGLTLFKPAASNGEEASAKQALVDENSLSSFSLSLN